MQAIQASMADMPLYERELFELYRNQENPGAAQNNANAQAPALLREESKEIKGYTLAQIKSAIPARPYSASSKAESFCLICMDNYEDGDQVR